MENNEIVKVNTEPVITSSKDILVVQKDSMPQKLIDCNVQMMAGDLPFYGEFNLFINFIKAKIGTCGVNVSEQGMNFYWDEDFINSLENSEANFVLIHEDCHLLFDHMKRSVGYDRNLANICQDMIINQIIHDEIMSKPELRKIVTIPKNHDEYILDKDKNPILDDKGNKIKNPAFNQNIGLFIPKEYPGKELFEDLYEWMKEKQKDFREQKSKDKSQQQQQQQQGQSGDGQSVSNSSGDKEDKKGKGKKSDKSQKEDDQSGDGQSDNKQQGSYGKNGKNDVECQSLESILQGLEEGKQMTLDKHLSDDVPQEAKKSMIDDFTNRLKNRGLVTDEVEKVLRKLKKSKKDYLKEIKRTLSNHVFGKSKQKSITRPNRRGIEGLKGRKKYQNMVNCMLDTSGSMCGDFEKVLSYIFQNDIIINMIQCDTEVKNSLEIKSKNDLNKMTIKGLGGTTLQPGIDFINDKKNGISQYSTVILTDGYTDSLDLSSMTGKVLILSTSEKCPIKRSNGKLKQIIIDRENSIYDKP